MIPPRRCAQLVTGLARSLTQDLVVMPFNVVVNVVASSVVTPRLLRTLLYRLAGVDAAWSVIVQSRVAIRTKLLTIGADSTVNRACLIENVSPVAIGANTGVGIGTQFITTHHESDDPRRRAGIQSSRPIKVGDGVWIGSGAVLLGGVTVGDGCIIGAGAVVNRDCLPHGLYAGVPARRLRELPT